MRRMTKIIAAIALCLMALLSCTHKELCYHHPHTAGVRINVDWSKFDKEVPTGMTVLVYDEDGRRVTERLTHQTDHALFKLEEGLYHSIVYNQSATEFGTISFRGMDDYRTATVYTNNVSTKWYTSKANEERVGSAPEWIGADNQENMEVTAEMVQTTTEHVINDKLRSSEKHFVIATHVPQNLIYKVYVKVHLNRIYNLKSARASMTGLAEGYVFHRSEPTESIVTQLLENWSLYRDDTDPMKGYITTCITCFGLPYGHDGRPEANLFTLSVLLVDSKTMLNFPFNVGDKFRKRIVDGVEQEMEYEIELIVNDELPDVPPEGGSGGGFDAIVDDWGEEQNVEIPL